MAQATYILDGFESFSVVFFVFFIVRLFNFAWPRSFAELIRRTENFGRVSVETYEGNVNLMLHVSYGADEE